MSVYPQSVKDVSRGVISRKGAKALRCGFAPFQDRGTLELAGCDAEDE
jgi:hypothetical protein